MQPGNDQMWPGIGVQETVPCYCRHGQVSRFEGRSSLSSRCSNRPTPVLCHLPPRGDGIFRSFSSCATALMATKPAFRSSRIVEARALARASAAFLFDNPLLVMPLVIRPRRVIVRTTVV